jgi:serine/threonine-protein kinase
MGTPLYIAPEVANGLPADARTDVYSMGAVLYFTLTARPPYAGDTVVHLLTNVVKGEAPPPSVVLEGPVPAEIERITMRCLSVDPAERYADGGELADALLSIRTTTEI